MNNYYHMVVYYNLCGKWYYLSYIIFETYLKKHPFFLSFFLSSLTKILFFTIVSNIISQ